MKSPGRQPQLQTTNHFFYALDFEWIAAGKKLGYVGQQLRQKFAATAIPGAPCDCITIVRKCKISGRHSVPAMQLTDDFSQDLVRRSFVKQQVSVEDVTIPITSLHLAATRLWYEWCCNIWVARLNTKGVSASTKLLLTHYYQFCPPRPQAERFQQHKPH